MVRTATALFLLLVASEVRSETVDVKYRGPVDLKTFECRDINRSSFIQRVCYDKAQSYMVLVDNKVSCKNVRCRKPFDISGIKSMAFL